MVQIRQGVALFMVGFAYLGCSAQAEPDYWGEPLARVHGTVVTNATPPDGDIDAALLWLSADSEDPSIKLATAVVRGSFPASFTLEVLAPPPPGSNPLTGGIRYGIIAAIKHQSGTTVPITDIVGTAAGSLVVYFPNGSTEPNDFIAQQAALLNVPPTRGYHLLRTVVTEESEGNYYRCQYEGVCERSIVAGTNDALTPAEVVLMQAYADRVFALCTKYLPDAPRCEVTTGLETDPCIKLLQAREQRLRERVMTEGEAGFCPSAWSHPATPEDFERPVTVTLGTTIYDALYPSTLSLSGSTE